MNRVGFDASFSPYGPVLVGVLLAPRDLSMMGVRSEGIKDAEF